MLLNELRQQEMVKGRIGLLPAMFFFYRKFGNLEGI